MMRIPDESAKVLIAVNVSTSYSFFIAIRLVGANFSTVCCAVAIDMFLHSKITYDIVKNCRKVTERGIETINTKGKMKITMLSLAELIEGLTPLIYGTGMALAFYGPNSRLFSDVKNNYWSNEIENLGPLFNTVSILFGVDTLSALGNSFCLWKILKVNMLSELTRLLTKYGHFMAIAIAIDAVYYFSTKDINMGIDPTMSHQWITTEGWMNLVNNSIDLTKNEKAELLAKSALI